MGDVTDTRRRSANHNPRSRFLRVLLFPSGVLLVYVVLLVFAPERASRALRTSGAVLIQLIVPLCIAFVALFLLNLYVKWAHISRLLGKGHKAKGILFSSLAGIVSMGPIYAWYPLLKDLREKGASDFHLANFLTNRAVKPFLLPLMVYYFGWVFTLVLNLLIVAGAILTGLVVSALSTSPDDSSHRLPDRHS